VADGDISASMRDGASQRVPGTQSIVAAKATMLKAKNCAFLGDLVRDYFTNKLLGIARDIVMHIHAGSSNPDNDFPFLAGSYLDAASMGSPALAFVRSVCAVFALDDNIRDETATMRKVLLKFLHVKEFSKEASYVDLCQPFVLRNVSCAACHDCRDIDISRDRQLTELGVDGGWICHDPSCRQPYDLAMIESRLVEYVQRILVSYNVQDLRCNHCNQIKGGRLQEFCSGSKDFALTVPDKLIENKLLILHNCATIHSMELLRQVVEWARPELKARYTQYIERMRETEADEDDAFDGDDD